MHVIGRPTSGERGGNRATIGTAVQSTYARYLQPDGAPRHEPQVQLAARGLRVADCYPRLVNTSFNVRGEPIVCTPEEAYRCFMRTEMDYLVMENILLAKKDQPSWQESGDWRKEFTLD